MNSYNHMPEKKALSQKNNLDIQRTLQPLPRYLKRLTNGNGQRILKGLIFDVIDHSLLLQKLKANGISGAEHAWFFSYLTNRKQFVQCNGVNSNERTVTHGVPQGSILFPTLFCIHINGVVSTTPESSVFLYADDTETHQSSPTLETGCSQNKF